jgi:phospholipase C
MNAVVPPDPIRNIVLLMIENRSFDQMLGALASQHDGLDGIFGGAPPRTNRDAAGKPYEQLRSADLQMALDPDHDNGPVLDQLADDNGGFIKDFVRKHPASTQAQRMQIMGYYEFGFLPAMHTLGDTYLVCDRWFSSLPGPTWPNRFFALTGTSNGHVRMPNSITDPYIQGFFNQTQDTIFDRLNEANIEWLVYHYGRCCSWVLTHQRRLSNLSRYRMMDSFFDDAAAGNLPPFVFIEPKYSGRDQNDDHPPHNIMKGEKLVADVYNALRTSPLWNETLLVVVFDEHGGFYDHVQPPATVPPDEFTKEYSFDRLGVRVPAILVSPRLARGVDHTEFDHTSLLKYLSEKWNLGPLGERVAHANSIATAMRFLPEPRSDTVPFIRVRNSDLYAPEPELEEFDRSAHHAAFEAFADFLTQRRTGQSSAPAAARAPSAFRQWLGTKLMAWGKSLSTSSTNAAALSVQLREEVDADAKRADQGIAHA